MLTWRKTYRKYKPRTTPGKCNVCAKKAVRQAYCTVCRPCAQTHGVCEKCGQKPKEGKVQAPQSKEEQLAEEQRLQYELKFMSERQRRSALRKMEQEGDRQYQRRLAFLERKKAEAAEAGEEAEAWDEHEDEWASATQPTDLQSQQRVLVAFYAEFDAAKTAEDVRGIIDKRRGTEPVLAPDDWNLLCAKLKLKYGQHPLEVMAANIDRELGLEEDEDDEEEEDFDLDGEGSEFTESEYADSLMDAMEELGWESDETEEADVEPEPQEPETPEPQGGGAANAGAPRFPAAFYADDGMATNTAVRENIGEENPLAAAAAAAGESVVRSQAVPESEAVARPGGTVYVVEHLEDEMGCWCTCEYMHMLDKLQGDASRLLITNMNATDSKWISDATRERGYGKGEVECDPRPVAARGLNKAKVCLLDMRAEKPLAPEDANQFTHFLLGGILGDDPPQDRTKQLRDQGFELRHMNDRQMATNTAMIVADMILSDGKRLEDIDFVDDITLATGEPESGVDETTYLPYRYLRANGGVGVRGDVGDGQPLLAPGLLDYLRSDEPFF